MTADLFDILPRRQIKRRGKPAQQYIESTSPLSQRDSYVWTEDQRFDYETSFQQVDQNKEDLTTTNKLA